MRASGVRTLAAATTGALLLALSVGAPARAGVELTCNGYSATIIGTEGDDVLTGTDDRDVIIGLDGDDEISGLGGGDILCGGAGRDVLLGGVSDDDLVGAQGDDHLEGGDGYDDLWGDGGDDFLDGGTAGDELEGGSGDDVLRGGDEPACAIQRCWESIRPGGGDDDVDGGVGANHYARIVFEGGGGVRVNLRKGFARGYGHDTIANVSDVDSTYQDDRIIGTAGPNQIYSENGQDVIRAGAGDDVVGILDFQPTGDVSDTIELGPGDDSFGGNVWPGGDVTGGPGDDFLSVDNQTTELVPVYGGQGNDTITATHYGISADGGRGDDQLTGSDTDDVLQGGAGKDTGDGLQGIDECRGVEHRTSCELP